MKTLNPTIAAELAKQQGIEPVCIVEVQWVEGGQFIAYSDQEYPEEPSLRGQILTISTLESVVKLDQSGQSQSINVVLSDVDNSIKEIIDVNNIHGRQVNVYIWVRGIPLTEKVLLYQGEINGPVEWNSGDRTFRFEVITQLANREVGFSPEQGLFADIPNPLVGKAWPIVFGLVQNVPAVPLQDIPRTNALQSIGVKDPTLGRRIGDLLNLRQEYRQLFLFYAIALGTVEFQIDFEGRFDLIGVAQALQAAVDQLATLIAQISAEIDQLLRESSAQDDLATSQLEVIGGERYPQGQTISLVVENPDGTDVKLTGSFSGSTFNIDDAVPLDFDGETYSTPFGFTFVQAGASIRVEFDDIVRYIANLNRSEIRIVRAWKGTAGNRALVVVPPNLYTVEYQQLGPFEVTLLRLPKALSHVDSSWENDLYVTQEDTIIGSNTVDVMEWLVTTFTDLAVDATSFAEVKTKLENYPSHFALLDQWNILDLLEAIMFQARTVGYVVNNTVFLKYLSFETASTSTIGDSDVKAGTVRLLSTSAEELVTKLVAEWTDDYALETPHRYILRHNVPIYGVRERVIDFFIYNIAQLVIKSATFWVIRLSNIWKRAKFKTYLNKMEVETFDTVSLNLTGDFFATGNIEALITELTFDSGEAELDIECWLPVKFGTMTKYVFAWPHDADITEFFPQPNEIPLAGSSSPQKDVEGEIEFGVFANGVSISVARDNGARIQRYDYGELTPSDLDDVKPFPEFAGNLLFSGGDGPDRAYNYGDYPFQPPTLDDDRNPKVYPAVVLGGGPDIYSMNVYTNGLINEPINQSVKQLQHDGTSTLPVGSWTLVLALPIVEIDEETGEIEVVDVEWTMQIPVWL